MLLFFHRVMGQNDGAPRRLQMHQMHHILRDHPMLSPSWWGASPPNPVMSMGDLQDPTHWRYVKRQRNYRISGHMNWWYIPWNLALENRPYIWNRYLQFRFLKWPLIICLQYILMCICLLYLHDISLISWGLYPVAPPPTPKKRNRLTHGSYGKPY